MTKIKEDRPNTCASSVANVPAEFGYRGKATPQQIYQGLKNLEGFDRREPAEQDEKLRQIETTLFFSLLRQNSIDGAKLILLVPPTPSSEDAVRQITIASQKAYVETLVPIDPTALPARYYLSDKLHLNSEGAALFTTALAEFLPQTIVGESLISPD